MPIASGKRDVHNRDMPDLQKPKSSGEDQDVKTVFEANLKFLDLFLVKNLISETQFNQCKTALSKRFGQGEQQYLDLLPELTELIQPELLHKTCYKYNQIILRLSLQFLRNTLRQQIQDHPDAAGKEELKAALSELDPFYSDFLDEITRNYLARKCCCVDLMMLEKNIIDSSQLRFLHGNAIHLEIKAMDKKFGELAVTNRFATKQGIKSALSEQTRRYLDTGKNHIIGDILVERREMTPQIRDDILLLQNRFPDDAWERSLREAVGSFIEQKEKSALFGALVIREQLLDEASVISALKQQSLERIAYERKVRDAENEDPPADGASFPSANSGIQSPRRIQPPRWIGDILVEDYGLSESGRKRVLTLQMGQRIEIINLKFGVALDGAQKELIEALDQMFVILYTENRLQAVLRVEREIPDTLTTTNIVLWLYHKKVTHGIVSSAIRKLAENRVKPGEKIVVAQGTAPIPDRSLTTQLFMKVPGFSGPAIVKKDDILVKLERQPGESGVNVNHCYISPPVIPSPLNAGINVRRMNNEFFAECDGAVSVSPRGTVDISTTVDIPGDLDENSPVIDHDCDVRVRKRVLVDICVTCRDFKAVEFRGRLISRGEVGVDAWVRGAEISARGVINLAGVSGARVTGNRDVLINGAKSTKDEETFAVRESIIICQGSCIVSGLNVDASVLSAGEKIILRNTRVGRDCRLVAGDTPDIYPLKEELKAKDHEFQNALDDIRAFQKEMQFIYSGISEMDFTALDQQISTLNSKMPKTKSDIDQLRELKKQRRQLEKDKGEFYNKHGNTLLILSKKISFAKYKVKTLEEENQILERQIQKMYKGKHSLREIDARKAVLTKGVTLEFPQASLTLDSDSSGSVFREEFCSVEKKFKVKKYKW